VPDDTVSGGLEVTGDAGRICIDNTLEKRLERGWQDLLPILVSAIRREFGV
jgi:vacuolar-type H+-ATPase subunit E/Vma4